MTRGAFSRRFFLDRLLAPVITVVFAGVLVTSLVAYFHTKAALEDLARSQTVLALNLLDRELGTKAREMNAKAEQLGRDDLLRLALEDSYLGQSARAAALRRLQAHTGSTDFTRIYLLNHKGIIVQATDPGLVGTLDVSDRPYFLEARRGRAHMQTVPESRVSGQPLLVFSAPVLARDGKVVGVVACLVETEVFARSFLNQARIGQTGGAYVLGPTGLVLSSPAWAVAGQFDPGANALALIASAEEGGTLRYVRPDGPRLCVTRRNDTTGWVLVVEADEGEVLAPARRLALVGGGISLLTLLLVALALGALRRVMSSLRRSEADHRALADLSPVGIVTTDPRGRPVYLNRQAQAILDLPEGAPLPQTLSLEDDQGRPLPEADSPLAEAMARGGSVVGRLVWHTTVGGTRKALFLNATPLAREGAEPHGLVATLEDITERMQALELLHESEERFSSLFRLSPDSIVLTDFDTGAIVDINETFTNTFGFLPEEARGRTAQSLGVYVDDAQRQELNDLVRRDGFVLNAEARLRSQDGREGVFSVSSQTMEIGEKRYRMTVARDITERKKAEQALRESETFLSTLLESIPVPVFYKDAQGRYMGCNTAFEGFFGVPKQNFIGKSVFDLHPRPLAEIYHAKDRELFEGAGSQRYESQVQTMGLGLRDVIFHKAAYAGESGEVQGLVGAILDITDRKQAEEALRQSESRIRLIAESAHDAIVMIDAEGRTTFWNPAAQRMFGYTADEILGHDLHAAIAPERYLAAYSMAFPKFQETGQGSILGKTVDMSARRKDGSEFSVSLALSPLNIQGHWHAVGILRDMTERKAAEEALRRTGRALTAFKEFSASMLQASDEAAFITDICRILVEVCGYRIAWVGLAEDGPRKSVRLVGQWGDESGLLPTLDITWDDSPTGGGCVGTAIKTRTPQVSRELESDPRFEPWREFMRVQKLKALLALPLCHAEHCLGALGIYAHEAEAFDPAETELLSQLAGDLTFGILSLRRREAHQKAEDALAESEQRFRRIVETTSEAILLVDLESSRIVDVNKAFTEMSGYEPAEAIGKTTEDLQLYVDPAVRQDLSERVRAEGHAENLEFEARRKDGRTIACILSSHLVDIGARRYILVMARDVSELKKMQEMMIQTEKMISVGGIAAGIAHEINNPLGIVFQASQNLAQRMRPDFPKNLQAAEAIGLSMDLLQQYMKARKLDQFIEDIQNAATRASAIIRHMLDFSRRSESRRKLCSVVDIVEKALALAGNDYDLKKSYDFKRIRIERDYADDLPTLGCTETEIEQVLLNLLRNAAQALASMKPPAEDPRISIRVWREGPWVRIELADNGPGMPPEVQRRIFEPFFTTKPPGVGTGLGLSVSYFIISKSHGGKLSVSSRLGGGTSFTIDLPVDDAREA